MRALDPSTPAGGSASGMTLGQRFFNKTRPAASGCVEWTGALHGKRYGHFRLFGRIEKAHRVAWLLAGRDLPDDALLLHSCDNPACVNVAHLSIGTNDENMADRQRKGRQAKGPRNARSKLTPEQVLLARELRGKESASRIAARFGVLKHAIQDIYSGRTWSHLHSEAA